MSDEKPARVKKLERWTDPRRRTRYYRLSHFRLSAESFGLGAAILDFAPISPVALARKRWHSLRSPSTQLGDLRPSLRPLAYRRD